MDERNTKTVRGMCEFTQLLSAFKGKLHFFRLEPFSFNDCILIGFWQVLYSVKYTPYEYYQIASDTKKRGQFIGRVFNMVSRNNFDGLNLNWQHSMQK